MRRSSLGRWSAWGECPTNSRFRTGHLEPEFRASCPSRGQEARYRTPMCG
jgi:hypothetical protein